MKPLTPNTGPSQPRQTRRPYTMTDIRYVHTHYKDCTAAELAQQVGRTVGSNRGNQVVATGNAWASRDTNSTSQGLDHAHNNMPPYYVLAFRQWVGY